MKMNGTCAEIRECLKQQFGFVPKTSWISHVKELLGLRDSPSRAKRRARHVARTPDKRKPIEQCMRRVVCSDPRRSLECMESLRLL
jgi:hypothetical protein